MHHVPRIIIAIPIAVMVLVVYIKMAFPTQFSMLTSSQPRSSISSNTSEYTEEESLPSPQKSDPVSFDIVKPRICEYAHEGLTAKVYIQNSKVSATITQKDGIQNVMLINDCAHIWKEGESSGQQICGISQYLGLFQTYSSSGDMLSNVLNSCVEGPVNEDEFVLPTGITFKESSPEQAQQPIDK